MRSTIFIVLGGVLLSSGAHAQDEASSATSEPAVARRHRVSVAGVVLSNQSWGAFKGGGPGAALDIGYDLFFTGRQAVGVVVEAAVDLGSYGDDADAMSWRSLGLRYTHLLASQAPARFVPFVSAGLSLGRTGGQLQSYNWMKALTSQLGVEWLAARHFSVDLALTDQLASIAFPVTWWHNAVGLMLAVDAQLPF